MAASLNALHDHGVGAGRLRCAGLVGRRRDHADGRARVLEAVDVFRDRHPNVNETMGTRSVQSSSG